MNEKEELISFCGLYCDDCFFYKGKIASLAEELDSELKDADFKKTADVFAQLPFSKAFENYGNFEEILNALKNVTCVGCRERQGQYNCEISECCNQKQIIGCWECEEFPTCTKLDFLQKTHGNAVLRNLDILKEKGVDVFLCGERYWDVG